MDRKQQQSEFIYQVGFLLRPVFDVVNDPDSFDGAERRQARAQFDVDHYALLNKLKKFCSGEPGADYRTEWHDIQRPLAHMYNALQVGLQEDPAKLREPLSALRVELLASIAALPVPSRDAVYEAHTPFSTYCRLKELCMTATNRLIYVDRYVDDTIFHRLLTGAQPKVAITVVTWPRSSQGSRTQARFDHFVDISQLFSTERPSYRLLLNHAIHDRWLICDDLLFHLGGSAKDAANAVPYTVSRLERSAENLRILDDVVANAVPS